MKNKIITGVSTVTLITVLTVSIITNVYQYYNNQKLVNNLNSLSSDITAKDAMLSDLTEQMISQQSVIDTYKNQSEKYWTLRVDDYEILLQEGTKTDTLDLIYCRDDKICPLITFQKDFDYQTPSDISAEYFEECLGHTGFRLYTRHLLGGNAYYYDVTYYAVENGELKELAYRWGDKDKDVYEVDIDDDGINELICNVTWLADGATDVLIYHYDGKQVLESYGGDLLDEAADIYGVGSVRAEYLPKKQKILISYWRDDVQDYLQKEYNITFTSSSASTPLEQS